MPLVQAKSGHIHARTSLGFVQRLLSQMVLADDGKDDKGMANDRA